METVPPASFLSLTHEFDNFDEFNQSIKGWSTAFKQVDRGVASVVLRHRMTPLINALDVRFSHSTASIGAPQYGHRTFGMVDKDDGCTWCGYDVMSNFVLRFDFHDEFFTYTPRGFLGRTLSVEENLLASIGAKLGFPDFIDDLDRSNDVLAVDPQAMDCLQKQYDQPMHNQVDLVQLVEQLVILVGERSRPRPKSWQRNASQLVDRALEYIAVNAKEAITVADVCDVLGVGYRTLDRAFSRKLGHGPKDSILACRLNGVRAALRSADPVTCVVDIANEWGFWHMGDFARLYRKEFGELPSDSIKSKHGVSASS